MPYDPIRQEHYKVARAFPVSRVEFRLCDYCDDQAIDRQVDTDGKEHFICYKHLRDQYGK